MPDVPTNWPAGYEIPAGGIPEGHLADDVQAKLNTGSEPGTVTTWDSIQDKPDTFTPSPHTHPVTDVEGLEDIIATHETTTNKGIAGGYAPLGDDTKIPAAFIPGSVDDILEFPALADFPQPGLSAKMYVDLSNGKEYRWSGTQYTEIAASPGSTDAVPEGAVNKYYTDVRATAAATTKYEARVVTVEGAVTAIQNAPKPPRLPLGQRSTLAITPTLTALSTTPGADVPTIAGGVITSGGSDNRISPSGGTTLRTDIHDASAYCYQWLLNAGGTTNIGSPQPTSWSVGFEIYGTDEVEFIVNAYSSFFNLTVDGDRVWWTSQQGPSFDPSAGNVFGRYSIKFKLPDTGKYDLRFYMSSMSLESVCIGETGWLITKPLAGPRCYFLGDRTTQGFTGEMFNTIGSWIYWFANFQGLTDIWNDGQANTGPTLGSHATYPLRATATLVPANPEVVFIQGYESEKAANTAPAAVAAAIASTIDIARTAPNNPAIVVVGSPEFTGARSAQDIAIAGAIHTVCTTKGVAWIDPESGEVWNTAGQLVLAPAGAWITTDNRQAFVDNLIDGVANTSTSLSDLGQSYFGYKMWEAVQLLDLPAFA